MITKNDIPVDKTWLQSNYTRKHDLEQNFVTHLLIYHKNQTVPLAEQQKK